MATYLTQGSDAYVADGGEIVHALNGDDTINAGAGSDTVYGDTCNDNINSGSDTIDGGASADTMTGGSGNDTFMFRSGQLGDIITDFAGNGAAAGDELVFLGFGPGATSTQLDATTWRVTYNGGTDGELLAFTNAQTIVASDYMFT